MRRADSRPPSPGGVTRPDDRYGPGVVVQQFAEME